MKHFDPEWRPVAFKEWQLVAEALASGEQSVILRKGGISEGKLGFQWLHEKFFLFPSLFHEQAQQVKPLPDGSLREIPKPAAGEGEIVFSVYVEAIKTDRLTDWDEVLRLAPYHIWKEEIVRERFEWGDEYGLSYAVVKAWQLTDPWILPDRTSFGGCRSWFGLPSDEGGGWLERLESARAVEATVGLPDWLI
jgi:hypothetical protein